MQSTESPYTVYAGFFVRLAAYLFDLMLFGALSLGVRLSFWAASFSGVASFFTSPLLFSFTCSDILLYLLCVAYFVLSTHLSGATLGKRLFHLRVVTASGERPSLFDLLYRETIGRYLSSLLFVGYLLTALTAQKKALHDILCDTRVVYTCRFFKTEAIQPPSPAAVYAPAAINAPKVPAEALDETSN